VETESDDADRFWASAEPFLAVPGVGRSTMMGLPCLRVDGQFFASYDRRTGDLLVKVDASRVADLITTGDAHAFAPAGRKFREWAAIAPHHERLWSRLLGEAFEFVSRTKPDTGKRP
jgi:hypothetical protein